MEDDRRYGGGMDRKVTIFGGGVGNRKDAWRNIERRDDSSNEVVGDEWGTRKRRVWVVKG